MLWLLLTLTSFLIATQAQDCGPTQCYASNGCGSDDVPIDFVFLMDTSGSMDSEIDGVRSGLSAFAESLGTIDAKWSLILFADSSSPKLQLNAGTYAQFKTSINSFSLTGGYEAGLEAIMCALGEANYCPSGYPVNYRSDAKKVFILVTDEDSDIPYLSANRYGQDTSKSRNACREGNSKATSSYTRITNWLTWQNEVDAVAAQLLAYDVALYMLISEDAPEDTAASGESCLTRYQYSNPTVAVEADDYTGFDSAATLLALEDGTSDNCLQAQVLRGNGFARAFDVFQANDPDFVANFFSSIVADLTQCDATCYFYGCTLGGECLPPTGLCDCNGVPFLNGGDAVEDCSGICDGNSFTDCFGVCINPDAAVVPDYGVWHECGLCVPNSQSGDTNPGVCDQDCDDNFYVTSQPTVPYKSPMCENWLDTSDDSSLLGYVAASLTTNVVNNGLNTDLPIREALCEYFSDNQFTSPRPTICEYDSATCSSATVVLNGGDLSSVPGCCVTDTEFALPPYSLNDCDECETDNSLFCELDCNNVYHNSSSTMWQLDICSRCKAPGDSPDVNSCGFCCGQGAEPVVCPNSTDYCGVCSNLPEYDNSLDGCGQPSCQNLTCLTQCDNSTVGAGVPFTLELDPCGNCVLISEGQAASCLQDCNSVYYDASSIAGVVPTTPTYVLDPCDYCQPNVVPFVNNPLTFFDCDNTACGDAYLDPCNQCVVGGVPDSVCGIDCAGVYYNSTDNPQNDVDACGVCSPFNEPEDRDNCGQCLTLVPLLDCVQDCKNVWNLPDEIPAIDDDCSCWGPDEYAFINSEKDCCGICVGEEFYGDLCQNDTQGVACDCNEAPTSCDLGLTTCLDDCPPGCADGGLLDSCGKCPGDFMYDMLDECDQCCSGNETHNNCNADFGTCDVCFDYSPVTSNVCGTCNDDDCIVDCRNESNMDNMSTWGYDCALECVEYPSLSVCSNCGNGVVDDGEECDKGLLGSELCDDDSCNCNDDGCKCNTDCQFTQNQTGGIIGGIIGGLLGLLCLAATAFLAYRYAVKSGLLGNANTAVDMGCSNNNPLYDGQTTVSENPLYAS